MLRRVSSVVAVLALAQALPAASQEIDFGGDVFDVTAADMLDVGNLGALMKPFR